MLSFPRVIARRNDVAIPNYTEQLYKSGIDLFSYNQFIISMNNYYIVTWSCKEVDAFTSSPI
jgi:hypothetical protein